MEQPIINLSSKYIGDENEIKRQEELRNKKTKWITESGFNTNTAGKGNMMGHKEKYSDNYYVTVDASGKSARDFRFREQEKEKILFGHFQPN